MKDAEINGNVDFRKFETWVTEKGFPLVKASLNGNGDTVVLRQDPFSLNGQVVQP